MRTVPITLFVSLLLQNMLHAQSVDALVRHALGTHPSIQAIEHKLSAMDEKIQKSTRWQNPDLALTLNDIQLRKPLDRGVEPMQYQALSFKQRFPWFGKLNAKRFYAEEEKEVVTHTLEGAKVALAKEIRTTAYAVKELEARIALLERYTQLAKENIDLYTNYITTQNMSHAQSVSASLSLSNIQIRKEHYRALLQVQKEKLAYLAGLKIWKLHLSLRMVKPRSLRYYLSHLDNNPLYRMKRSQTDAAGAKVKMTELESYPDPFVQLSYANREDFPDYTSVSIGVSLPVYGTEALDTEIAKKERLSRISETIDYREQLKSRIRQTYAKLTEAQRIYRIITRQSLPQLQHMLELSSSAIEEGADLLTYTKILEEMLMIEEERIRIKSTYLKTLAQLNALIGKK